jgi:sugar lactone lactonase YvrE
MSPIKQIKVTEPWLKTSCGLGEAPFWDKKSNTLRFLDIIKKQLHVVNLSEGPSSHKTIDLPFSIGTTANIEGNDEEFIFGGKEGYGIANKKTGEPRYITKRCRAAKQTVCEAMMVRSTVKADTTLEP